MTELYVSTITELNPLVENGDISTFQPLYMLHFSSNQLTLYDSVNKSERDASYESHPPKIFPQI